MGVDHSQYATQLYETALTERCVLPDVSIDRTLLKYSGLDSNYQLQQLSSQLAGTIPGYISRLGSAFAPFTAVPNAVGLGALLISLVMEITFKSALKEENTFNLVRRAFGEEKASAVRDTMSEFSKQHYTFLNNKNQLQEELRRLRAQLSQQLTQLKNSMLVDRQISTRSFNIWVNGASFDVLILIHQARLSIQPGHPSSNYVYAISRAIDLYLLDLDLLLEKYKSYMSEKTRLTKSSLCPYTRCVSYGCKITNIENGCEVVYSRDSSICTRSDVKEAYINHVFSTYGPILGLRSHFFNMKTNLNVLINQHDSFILPSAA